MRFVKYHGLGNDFILVDPSQQIHPELARTMCQRGFGIGADGLMRAAPPETESAHLRMDLINSDGSFPEMCGNGLRCLVRHAVEDLQVQHNPLSVETGAGTLQCHWHYDAERQFWVQVGMGNPRIGPAQVGLDSDFIAEHFPDDTITLNTHLGPVTGLPVNTGNPHFVIFGDSSRERALLLGPELERHPAFPLKANIEFSRVLSPSHLRTTVWERGCGLTLACGTGATASAVAAVHLGLVPPTSSLEVTLPGGTLLIRLDATENFAWMQGPAVRSFEGEWSEPHQEALERWD